MRPYFEKDGITLYHGDCREILPTLGRFDAVVTDPPYAISVEGAKHVNLPGKGERNFDFFDGDSDWPRMRAIIKEALGFAVDSLKPCGSFYSWVGHRCFGDVCRFARISRDELEVFDLVKTVSSSFTTWVWMAKRR